MNAIEIKTKTGTIRAVVNECEIYPGIDVEFIANSEPANLLSRPRILIEQPNYANEPRLLIWDDMKDEDYTKEIKFSQTRGN